MTSLLTIVALSLSIVLLSGFYAEAKIERLDIPVAVRNGSGPIELVCVYGIKESENYGLVVKWYHGNSQIYQWIPPMKPQDLGVIAGLTSYKPEIINRPQSHSIIHLKEVAMDMSGDYTCTVTTFFGEDVSEMRKMIVYVPERSLTIEASKFNETHVNLTCSAIGARPRPDLTIMNDLIVLENLVLFVDENDADNPRILLSGLMIKPDEPTVIECEIQIPGTGYGRRERLVYYPNEEERNPIVDYMNGALRLRSGVTSNSNADLIRLILSFFSIQFYWYFTANEIEKPTMLRQAMR